jgi:glucose/arabinose dehydrogenase
MSYRSGGARRRFSPTYSRPLAFETLEGRQLLAATPISVLAAGSTGSETFQLLIDNVVVANWTATRAYNAANRAFDTFTYTHPTDVTANRIRVQFTNDGLQNGADRNLWVDGIVVNNAKYETEATSVYSSGTYDSATGGRLPGYRQTETLHYNGYLQYGAANSTVQIRAAGATGQEQMQLIIAGQVVATYNNVGGNFNNRTFVTFNYTHTSAIPLNQVRVAYTNDGLTSAGVDKNLRIDAVVLDGVTAQAEAPTTFTTGFAIAGQGRQIGRFSTEILYYNGYFQFAAPGSVIDVKAAGRSGEERVELQIAGQTVATFNNVGGNFTNGTFQTFAYVHPTTVPLGDIRVAFTNDGTTSGGVAKDLRVDGVELDGVMRQAEAANTFTTGFWTQGIGQVSGLWQSEYLYVGGYLQFGSTAVPGTIALGTTLLSVSEAAGTAVVPVVRTGGSDGTVAVRYSTVNATATAPADYTGASAQLVVFGPGETTKSIIVPIVNDQLVEGNETFNVAIDQSLGGATTGVPRTATVTIIDDDGPFPPGTGNGLLGAYFKDLEFTEPVLERTDPTVSFDWGYANPDSLLVAERFAVRWTARVEARFSETYTFRTTTDDGVRLWVNNQLIIDDWNDHAAQDHFGSIALVAGQRYDLRMEYYESGGLASAMLAWSSSSTPLEIVPQSQLYSDPPSEVVAGSFSAQPIVTGLVAPTAIAFDAAGRMFISEQRGVVRVYQNGALLPTPFLDIQSRVNNIQDRGMLGIAVHPNFPATPYVYVAYTYDPPETLTRTGNAGPDGGGNRVARISRFTADPATGFNTALPNSEVVLVGTNSTWANISHPELDSTDDMTLPPSGGQNGTLRDILIADSRSHTIGNLAFGPDGMLYASSGDGTSYGRVDARTTRVQNLDSLSGKMLRVDPITGKGLADNPFYNGDPDANRSKVYNYGLRNPFRFAFQPGTGTMFVGDVGWTTWEEINSGRGKNFGWPYYEGGSGVSLQTGGYQDLPEAQAFYAANPNVQASVWARRHDQGAVAIVAGDFYTGSVYPDRYLNALFISDIGDNQIRLLRTNPDGTLKSVTPLDLSAGFVVEMTMGTDGYMYYANIGAGIVGRFVFTPAGAPAALSLPPAGDFDANGRIDGNDFLEWQRRLGADLGAADLPKFTDSYRSATSAAAPLTAADLLGVALFTDGYLDPPLATTLSATTASASSSATTSSPAPRSSTSSTPPAVYVVAQPAPGAVGTTVTLDGVDYHPSEASPTDAAFAVWGADPFAWIVKL